VKLKEAPAMRPQHWLYTIPLRLRSLFKRSAADSDLDDELQFHLYQKTQEFISKGLSAKKARYAALREFRGLQQSKENCRDARRVNWLQDFAQDLRFGVRMFRKKPGFTAVAVFTLAIGIAASTVVFSVIYNGLLRPFPYKNASRLTVFNIEDLRNTHVPVSGPEARGALASIQLINFQDQTTAFEEIVGFSTNDDVFLADGQTTLHLQAAYVTPTTFQFLGVYPLLGRAITPEDAKLSAPPVFAMNYRLWKKRFNSDPKVVGTSFVIGGMQRTLVAVMPPRFQIDNDDIWIPTIPDPSDSGVSTNATEPSRYWWALGRLRPGVSAGAASTDLTAIAKRLANTFPDHIPPQYTTVVTLPYIDLIVGGFRNTLYALAAAVAMLLLITCTNVTNLLLARGTTRVREIAIRASLGAGRSRLIRQFLVESLALATTGALAGCIFAYWGLKAVQAVIPSGTLPKEAVFAVNPSVLLFSLAVTTFTAILCGLVVALFGLRGELNSQLAGAGKGMSGGTRAGKLRSGLVIVELALSIVLLVAAGLMMRTLLALTHIDLGFSPANILVTELTFSKEEFPTSESKAVFLQNALQRIGSIPGVVAAATSRSLPPYGGPGSQIEIHGRSEVERPIVAMDLCSDEFFQTIGVHLLRGRLFTERDMRGTSRRVVIIDEVLARGLFPETDAVGRQIRFNVLDLIPDAPHATYFEIIGVVSSVKNHGLRNSAIPQAYLPSTTFATPDANILVRSAGNPRALVKGVHDAIASANSKISLSDTSPLESYLQRSSYASPEFGLVTFGIFAGIGLLLVSAGIYGLTAFTVSVQTHEIGIRMALGAQPHNVLKMILAKGSRLVVAGILIGLTASYGVIHFISRQVWGVTTTDPSTFVAVAVVAALAGLAAIYIPARRAMRVDPLVALRYE
jgi:predicted permease